ncbi:odorant receptor 4 [Halyomorpha halys]|uniref:odorant receptor 4 n=1 Tax=Halyomorpha halys TaxID=286706 RepID=UPI0006D5259D|nr:odorant receptor 24a-like [Halyomorpha halys]KAE8572936.1 Odorant receptor 65 [Halyomorpha halys]
MRHLAAITDSDVIDGLNIGFLKIFGVWGIINDYRTTGKKNFVSKFQVFITLLLAVPYIFCQNLSYFMIKVDIQKATFLNLHALPALQMCCKVMVFWFRLDSQSRLYSLVKKDFIHVPEEKKDEAAKIFKKITTKANLLCLAAFLVDLSITAFSIADPSISVDYLLHGTGSMTAVVGGKEKIMGGWYPLPMADWPYYEAIFIFETVLMIWSGVLLALYVSLFYQVLICLYAQFVVLNLHVSTLKNHFSIDCDRKNINNREVHSSLNKEEIYAVAKDHQRLLSYANELRSVYNPLVTMILGMGVFVLIIGVFQFLFGKSTKPMFIFKFMLLLAYQGVEVSMFCFGSSALETASSDLQFAIYSSDWYKKDIQFRKAVQMVMVGARKGVTLTAVRMYPVNVETVMAMLQFTYSVATLMSRMTE